MSDVFLFQTDDDGEINVKQGVVELTAGIETAVYLSLFGGNEKDDGSEQSSLAWWGNANVDDDDEKQISRLQNAMDGLPATSGNLLKLEDAAREDLRWLEKYGYVVERVDASMPGVNRVSVIIQISGIEYEFIEDWATWQHQ